MVVCKKIRCKVTSFFIINNNKKDCYIVQKAVSLQIGTSFAAIPAHIYTLRTDDFATKHAKEKQTTDTTIDTYTSHYGKRQNSIRMRGMWIREP